MNDHKTSGPSDNYDQLKKRIIRLLETNEIMDMAERIKIELLINSKIFNLD